MMSNRLFLAADQKRNGMSKICIPIKSQSFTSEASTDKGKIFSGTMSCQPVAHKLSLKSSDAKICTSASLRSRIALKRTFYNKLLLLIKFTFCCKVNDIKMCLT